MFDLLSRPGVGTYSAGGVGILSLYMCRAMNFESLDVGVELSIHSKGEHE